MLDPIKGLNDSGPPIIKENVEKVLKNMKEKMVRGE